MLCQLCSIYLKMLLLLVLVAGPHEMLLSQKSSVLAESRARTKLSGDFFNLYDQLKSLSRRSCLLSHARNSSSQITPPPPPAVVGTFSK